MQVLSNYTTNKIKYSLSFKSSNAEQYPFNMLMNVNENERSVLNFVTNCDASKLVSLVNNDGDHFIHIVVKKDYFEVLKYILLKPKNARELLELRGQEGKTPLAVATSPRSANLMLMKGANPYALDDNMVPAGSNEYVPEEIRQKVLQTSTEEIKKLQPLQKSTQSQQLSVQPQVDTTPLRNSAAQIAYSKIEPPEPKIEEKPKKSFFNMFIPKENVEPKEVEVSTKLVTEITVPDTTDFKRIDTNIKGLDYIVGLDEVKDALRKSIVEPVLNENIAKELNDNHITIPNGILLCAPAGNGKTTLVKALGKEAAMPVFEVSNTLQLGVLIDAIGKNFAKTKQRAIIYLRGLDNLYVDNMSNGHLTNDLNRILNETAKQGSLVIFSAECPERIPKSLLTPGKIDRILSFKSPDTVARLRYIENYIKDKALLKGINTKIIADNTQGFSVAQIKHVLDDAAIYAATTTNKKVTTRGLLGRIRAFSREQKIPEINKFNKTSMYDTVLKRYQPNASDAEDFDSVAGMQATKSSVEDSILRPWQNADKLRKANIQLPIGAVFAGDPGTSKSYIAKSLARSLNIPLYLLKMSEVGSSYAHETSKNIGSIIDQLITKFNETGEASILLMDEIDNFQKGNSQHGTEEVNTLLQEIERGANKILFIGTTNELESLPDSLTRDGRMGTVIHFEHCDSKAAGAIIESMLASRKNSPDVLRILENKELLARFAQRCDGMVAASVFSVVNDSLSDYIVKGISLEEAFDNAIKVRKKKDIESVLSKNSHSAGHRLNITEGSTIMYDTKYIRMYMDGAPKSLDALGGMEEVKAPLRSEIMEVYQPETLKLLKENGIPVTKGFILHGPSGNGKTTIIKALANEMKLPLYSLNIGNIGSPYVHELAKNANEVREQLAYKFRMTGERSILFMDEAQQLVPKTSGLVMAHSHNIEETNFFKDMIMTADHDGIIYAMATNDLEQIEPALYKNSERLGLCVYVGPPDLTSRVGIIKKVFDDRPITKSINNDKAILTLAESFDGQSISTISQIIMKVIRESIKSGQGLTLESTLQFIKRSI